ncbi:hypothetical protein BX616_010431 [Lobosporangium transversale]|uniref:Uncharacterized protein n=1 Tax=Lobosporangium transversale TaxID=64571 RepID=A0A1Y2GG99_9FUNG|nr:hypothetical protein BCR41DRAFT_398577 [Lobosporangium transversale]KAF9912030.1 hypothetical protein BX616_010431 [Lobosporangium transversale]ORZ10027.1 hypothetical protein BCR41DRAFT_398577 [Lobosporangium transversale]|eukprot:XP_021879117.1 hypothetical protein BCR41DRAFT_398577 [Lobosporangium transversale]
MTSHYFNEEDPSSPISPTQDFFVTDNNSSSNNSTDTLMDQTDGNGQVKIHTSVVPKPSRKQDSRSLSQTSQIPQIPQIPQTHPVKTQAELEKEKWQEIHRQACEANRKKYIDPKTGYTVMTELLHRRRGYCCGNACRHCPYNYENVGVSPQVKMANIARGKQQREKIEAIEGRPIWADDNSDDADSD